MKNEIKLNSAPLKTVADNQNYLTVVIVDKSSRPSEGVSVSINPGQETKVTNSAGEVQFKIGDSSKYDIKVMSGDNTVTVPYYVTEGGSTRLVINPVYVKGVEKALDHSSNISFPSPYFVGGAVVVIVLFFLIWRSFFRKK